MENLSLYVIFHCFSSVPLPKDVQHFQKEREIVINRALQVLYKIMQEIFKKIEYI